MLEARVLKMPCPKCGSMDRVPIAPGFYECRNSIFDTLSETTERCGTRYQGGQAELIGVCACGMAGIGICQVCGSPLCGHHAIRNGGAIAWASIDPNFRRKAEISFGTKAAEKAFLKAWDIYGIACESCRWEIALTHHRENPPTPLPTDPFGESAANRE